MADQALIDTIVQGLEQLKTEQGVDHAAIDQCIQAVQGQGQGLAQEGQPAHEGEPPPPPQGEAPPTPGAEPPPQEPGAGPPGGEQSPRDMFAAARQAVMGHMNKTGSMPDTEKGKKKKQAAAKAKSTATK